MIHMVHATTVGAFAKLSNNQPGASILLLGGHVASFCSLTLNQIAYIQP
jgi:hypothetical protein